MVSEMTTSTVNPQVANTIVFANGSMSAFGPPKVTVFTRKNEQSGQTETVHSYSDVPVFRSGIFSDSMGYEREWLPEQMTQMAANYDYLKGSGFFADVPVRKGHPRIFKDPMDGLIGYITQLRTEVRKSPLRDDENEYTYLIADYEILDTDAQEKIASGLWRNRSAEVGVYVTNAPVKEISPTFMGVAYVDIPAVEGLNGFAKQHQSENFSIQMEEAVMAPEDNNPRPRLTDAQFAQAQAQSHEFSIGGVTTNDPARVQQYINEVTTARDAALTEVASLNSRNAELVAFQANATKAQRAARLERLGMPGADGSAPVFTAPQLERQKAFAAKLDDETFEEFMKNFEGDALPPNPLLENYGSQNSDAGAPADKDAQAKATALEDAKTVVRSLRDYAKMSPAKIEESATYAKLKELGYTGSLASL